jgi:hypothetical protein
LRVLQVPGHEVGALAGSERAAVVQAQRARAVHGDAAQRLFGRHAEEVQAMFSISSSDSPGDEPGLWSLASAIGTPASRSACHRRQLGLAQEVEGAGQQHRHAAGGGHRTHAFGRQPFQVVAGQGAVGGGERRAAGR